VGTWLIINYFCEILDQLINVLPFHDSSDHDMCVPFTGSKAWTRSLGIVDEWRPWNWNDNGYAFINI